VSLTIEQMQEMIQERAHAVRPLLADYKRVFGAWVEADHKLMRAFLEMAEIMERGEFGFNIQSLTALQRVLEADIEHAETGQRVGVTLDQYREARSELRALMNRLSARMTYELSSQLTDKDDLR
jgi:hypothetical protein